MADRWAVVDWLRRGVPYREIHRQTGVSVTTIGRVARYLADGNGGYALAAQRIDGAASRMKSPESDKDTRLKLAVQKSGPPHRPLAGPARRAAA